MEDDEDDRGYKGMHAIGGSGPIYGDYQQKEEERERREGNRAK